MFISLRFVRPRLSSPQISILVRVGPGLFGLELRVGWSWDGIAWYGPGVVEGVWVRLV